MTTLQQYLDQQVPNKKKGQDLAEEWCSAIRRKFSEIREWLKQSDPHGVIDIEEGYEQVNEPGLGSYAAPRLGLKVVGRLIGIIPRARLGAGSVRLPGRSAPQRADGRMDITDDARKYVLFRCREGDQDTWIIDGLERGYQDHKSWPGEATYTPRSDQRLFDQEAFEKVLLSYLL
jgi:hypothetical protein